jgi:ATP-dependent DNA helicase RecQ
MSDRQPDLPEILKRCWGFDSFLPLQREAMECVLQGRESIVVLPTGGGKSLCYQAPALAMAGTAVVVSPLIALMKDQVDGLVADGISAARIDSSLTAREKSEIFPRLRRGEIKILYLSPERLIGAGDFLGDLKLSFIAVDEAHCISHWGHDFRPEYRQLGNLKERFPKIALHAYTATATEPVREDIARQLKLKDPEILVGSFDRPNLVYRVRRRTSRLDQVRTALDRHRKESGIVYCLRRRDVDELCAALTSRGYRAVPYHAGMSDSDRKQSQEDFITEQAEIIVATIAFGMGIDKSNVRFVVHAAMPKTLEHYQQESGRAGRDGLEAECVLFYSGADFMIWKHLLGEMPPEPRRAALEKLNRMYRYCTGLSCRHKSLLNYFGQEFPREDCGACDACLGELNLLEDSLTVAQKILSCVVRLKERFGADYTALVLGGSREERILRNGHDRLTTYGILPEYSRAEIRGFIEQLADEGYLEKTGEFNVLKATEPGWRVMRGEETPKLLKPPEKKTKKAAAKPVRDSWEGVDTGLFEALRELRREIAAESSVPAYIVFGDRSLRDMARLRPSTPAGFLGVSGVGEAKKDRYGDRFLELIKDYCASHGLETG